MTDRAASPGADGSPASAREDRDEMIETLDVAMVPRSLPGGRALLSSRRAVGAREDDADRRLIFTGDNVGGVGHGDARETIREEATDAL